MKRTVGFTMLPDGSVEQKLPQFGGVKGEHNATIFSVTMGADSVYQDGDIARLEFCVGDGTVLSSDILDDITVGDGRAAIRYPIPKTLTMLGGQLCIRLVVSKLDENGDEVETVRSSEMVLWFEEAPVENGTPFWTGVSEMLARTVSAKDAAVAAQTDSREQAQTASKMAAFAQTSADGARAAAVAAEETVSHIGDAAAAAVETYFKQHPTTWS